MNKIGLHVLGKFDGYLGRPAVVKLVDATPEYVRDIRGRVGVDCLIVVRWWEREQPLDHPEQRAREWFNRKLPAMQAATAHGRDPNVAFESYNEIADSQAHNYGVFECTRMGLMHAHGLRSVVGNWSVGVPDIPTWHTYEPVLASMRPDDLVGLHEYWSDYGDIDNPWHCGRWQMVPALRDKAIVVTECGRDAVEGRGEPGWQKTTHADQYIEDLKKYDALLCRFPNVVGGLVFLAGTWFDRKWDPYSVNGIATRIIGTPSVEPCPEPEPQPEPVLLPVPGARISQAFGARPEVYGPGGHPGVDLSAPRGVSHLEWHGTPVRATISGEAYALGDDTGYGLHVYIFGTHGDELLAHLARAAFTGKQQVSVGDVVGYAGYTGNSEPVGVLGTHVHWGIRKHPYQWGNGTRGYVDPLRQ